MGRDGPEGCAFSVHPPFHTALGTQTRKEPLELSSPSEVSDSSSPHGSKLNDRSHEVMMTG